MPVTVPQPILDILSQYAKGDKDNVKPLIEAVIHHMCNGNSYRKGIMAEMVYHALDAGIDPILLSNIVTAIDISKKATLSGVVGSSVQPANNPIVMMQAQAMTPAKPQSPHSPKGRSGPKPPYWFKMVTSIDRKSMNGYGLKGKFLNKDTIDQEQQGRIVVAQLKDFKTKQVHLYVLRTDAGQTADLVMPGPASTILTISGVEILDVLGRYTDLFDELENKCGIPS